MTTRINIGPIHPSTHGVLRLVVELDGDTIVSVEPHIGFMHRGVEKLVETRTYMQSAGYIEKLDYVAPMACDDAYVAAVEQAMGIEVKERAKYVRTVLLELQRIASHLLWLGTMLNDLGQFFTVFMWTFKDRDLILRLLEEQAGARMFYVNIRPGGMFRDLPRDFEEQTLSTLDYFEKRVREYEHYIESNEIFTERTKGIGVLSGKEAIALGVTGPVLRASGVNYDVRSNMPYYAYSELGFRPQVLTSGDSFARYKVRMLEIKESIRIVREGLKKMPAGDSQGLPIKLILPSAKNRIVSVSRETPRGEMFLYMVADPQRPYRLSIRSPSFINLSALNTMAKGMHLADLFAILGSLDLVMPDV
ncbi:MAG: NADPH-quinone oxidoreductase, partial [Candidatus Micrarchaeaceae archaeon]